jgi:class 3 adenylate cyclase/pimeloyl-ACP methyl ester carboxylesterase
MALPQTRYTSLGEADIAYQVVGDGPRDLVYVNGLTEHIDVQWEHPLMVRFLERLASFSRLIMFDRRGAGASDPVPLDALPTWEEWTEDLGAVLDAVGSEQAAIYAELDAGPMGMIFAATHPERTSALVLGNTVARYAWAADYPDGATPEAIDLTVQMFRATWGTEDLIAAVFPSMADDPLFLRWRAKYTRASATPRTAAAQYRYIFGLDVRSVLPSIRVPTLVLHRSNFPLVPLEHGQYLAEHISGARLVELPGADAWFFTEGAEEAVDAVAGFLTGAPPPVEVDRMLATVLFSDIVGSTERASALGDRAWGELLDAHNAAVRAELARFGGREVATAGDGFLATFPGPARAIRCAIAMRDAIRGLGMQIRVGVHTGEVEASEDTLTGIAVHIGARVAAAAQPDEVLVSRTVADLVTGSGIPFMDRGMHTLKGVPGAWQLFAVDR